MAEPIFTEQSLAHRASADLGEQRILLPPGFIVISCLLTFIIVSGAYFLTAQPYLRKTSVKGYIHNDITRIAAERSGTLTSIYVDKGQYVNKGTPLALIHLRALRQNQQAFSYDAQLDATEQQLLRRQEIQHKEFTQLKASQQRLVKSIDRLHSIQRLQTTRKNNLHKVFKASETLLSNGYLSQLEWGKFQDQSLAAEQRLEEITDKLEAAKDKLASLSIQQQHYVSKHALEILEIKQRKINLVQAKANWLANTQQIILAPVDGKVSSIFKQIGDVVVVKESLLTIIPQDKPLQARLLIPSHAVGFMANGQRINILYDAFPHLKFGSYEGKLIDVSSHTIATQDLPLEIPDNGIYYLATVALTDQAVKAYGITTNLRPGMTLKADIVLDRRTLFEWLLEPVMIARGRYV
ncbi:MAG: HlyD family secretion protein [Pseudomonadales bacterium]|nr:HlyD family secretion protein [Pseudomonadales bacterium]